MVKKFHKKTSRRLSTRRRSKIEKNVREYKRKLTKLKKKERGKNHFKITKKPKLTVPNEAPFKEAVLYEAEEARAQRKEELRLIREASKQKKQTKKKQRKGIEDDLTVNVEENPLLLDQLPIEEQLLMTEQLATSKNIKELQDEIIFNGIISKASENAVTPKNDEGVETDVINGFATSSIHKDFQKTMEAAAKKYYSEFKKVVSASDIILQILDARDPQGTRSQQVEEIIREAGEGKQLVLVLNKTDLVPQQNLMYWLQHLRKEYPTVAFKSMQVFYEDMGTDKSMRSKRMRARILGKKPNIKKKIDCVGAKGLIDLLKNYKRSNNWKFSDSLVVGVVGYPNVGKSSVINSLIDDHEKCDVSKVPGHTQDMQVIDVGYNIQVLDCPGVVIRQSCAQENVLRNAVKVDLLENPTLIVRNLLEKVPKQTLLLHYCIPDFTDTDDFLLKVAERRKYMGKRGLFNKRKAAQAVLTDWNQGSLQHCTAPPTRDNINPAQMTQDMFMGSTMNTANIIQLNTEHEEETVKKLGLLEEDEEELTDGESDDEEDEEGDDDNEDMAEDEEGDDDNDEEMESDAEQSEDNT